MTSGIDQEDSILDLSSNLGDKALQREVLERLRELLSETAAPGVPGRCEAQTLRSHEYLRTPESLRVNPYHVHRTILLAGRRGEGKTTFLTDLLRSYEAPQARNGDGPEKTPRLLSLGLIDPTMLESKQNVIMSVITRINECVEHNHRLGDCSGTAGDCSYRDVKEAFAKLAHGVTVLDGVGQDLHLGENWADARFIMEHGLERTEAAYDFSRLLRQYISRAASYLCCPGFLLCIDDVDTKFDIGQKVLEAIRKYLSSPCLNIIVSGDPELMLTLVRRLQWQEMGREYLEFEQDVHPRDARASQLDSALEQMSSLTDQYLTKVLPIERRLRLKTLAELDQSAADKGGLKVRFVSEENPEPIRGVVRDIANMVWGIRRDDEVKDLSDLLLRMPIRSTIEVLRAHKGKKGPGPILSALLQIAQTDLRNADAPAIDVLRSASAAQTFGLIASWFSKHHLWLSHGALAIRFADDTENRVASSISAVLAQRCRGDLGAILSFWLSFALLQDRAERQGPSADLTAEYQLFDFLGMGRLERPIVQVERLAAWERGVPDTRRVLGGLRQSGFAVPASRIRNYNEAFRQLFGSKWSYKNPPGTATKKVAETTELVFFDGNGRDPDLDKNIETFPEEIRAYHEHLKHAQTGGYRYGGTQQYLKRGVCNTIEDLTEGLAGAASVAVRLPYSLVISGQSAEFGNYGFPRLLAVMIEVLDAARSADSAAAAEKPVRAVIEQAIIPRGHATRFAGDIGIEDSAGKAPSKPGEGSDADAGEDLEDADEGETDPASTSEDTDLAQLTKALAAWAWNAHEKLKDKTIAPKVLLSIWKRFSFAQGRLFDDPKRDNHNRRYLGSMMHRSVVMFLHAVAVEAMRSEKAPPSGSLQNNPTHSDKLFASLLDEISSRKDTDFATTAGLAMFKALFACPLWGFFLKDCAGSEHDAEFMAKVRKAYLDGLAERNINVETLFAANFTPKGKDVTPVKFVGLHDLLNSVYLQA